MNSFIYKEGDLLKLCMHLTQKNITTIPCIHNLESDDAKLVKIPENSLCFFLGEKRVSYSSTFCKCLVDNRILWIEVGWFKEEF